MSFALTELRLSSKARSGDLTADDLHARLSAQTRREMSQLTSRTSSTSTPGGPRRPGRPGRLIVRPPDNAKLRISLC
jgi:hypothetical protein